MNSEPMLKIRLNSLFLYCGACIGAAALAANASAQMDLTARERVLDYIINSASSAGEAKPTALAPSSASSFDETADDLNQALSSEDAINMSARIDDVAAPIEKFNDEIITTAPTPSAAIIATPPAPAQDILTETERADSIVRDFSQITRTKSKSQPESFAFFTSAQDYLDQRGEDVGPRLTLRYDVSRKNAKTAVIGPSSIVDIIIGTDYAAISKSPDEIVIYDFKEKRLLNISKSDNSFTNTSLYAAAYRALDTVGKMTQGGKKRELALGADVTLDAFYLESALGYAAGPPPAGLVVTQEDKKILAEFTGSDAHSERVFSATLNGPELKNYRQAFSFLGLLYHSEPVHPAILAELKDVRAAPNAMTFHSYGPKIPDAEIISWALKSKMSETAPFPLPKNSKSIVENAGVSPLDFVMSEAAAGRALGGQVDPKSALTVVKQQIKQDSVLSAWVSAQSLKDMMGGCEKLAGLCKTISDGEAKKSSDAELSSLILALAQTDKKQTRIEGLTTLLPMITADDAPSLVLRRAGLALAKTTPAQREAAGLKPLDAEELLSQAIARNPYDLLAYQGLAQIKAARGDFIDSWDINDALRAFASAPRSLRAPIDKAETQLRSAAPGFFPPVDP